MRVILCPNCKKPLQAGFSGNYSSKKKYRIYRCDGCADGKNHIFGKWIEGYHEDLDGATLENAGSFHPLNDEIGGSDE